MRSSPDLSREVTLEEKITHLSLPGSYPEAPAHVEVIQTHMSWVFLTDRHAYKLKKPARESFLDFSTLAARHHYCEEEVRLNRRLAASVYLGVIALTADPGGHLRLQGSGATVEWLVKMRRLPRERMLDTKLRAGTLGPDAIRPVMAMLARFYRAAPSEPTAPESYRGRIERDLMANHAAVREHEAVLKAKRFSFLEAAHARFLRDRGFLLEQRAACDRIVEAHGDLRPEHVCLLPRPVIIDCLEFNRDFRLLDPAHELAYLAMECDLLGAPWIGVDLFSACLESVGGPPPAALLRFYQSERAVLRAKLALWHLRDHAGREHARWITRAQAYLSLAERYCNAL